jgi:HEAT repeat protein
MHAGTVGCDQRVAWLLTTNRILGADAALSRRDGFIKALLELGVHVDNSRISRWESGLQAVPGRVVATYESVLGLTEGSLVSVNAGLRRAFGKGTVTRESALSDADLPDADLDRLLDLAGKGEATGGHWLRLAGQLNRFDRVYLRQHEWAALCGRLVAELASSVGVGHVRRFEAAASLIRHANAQRHVTRALGGFVMNPDTQVVAPVLHLLTEVSDEAAGELVLRMLHAESKNIRSAAASVAAVKVARRHFPETALPELEAHVVGSLRRGRALDERLDSFDLAVQLPEESWARAMGGLHNRRAFDLVTHARSSGELVPSTQTSSFVNELSQLVQADTPTHEAHEPDAMLRRLLREALLHAHKARRHHAALLLAASPYAPAVAKHCQDLANSHNDLLAARAWTVLMRVGPGERRPRVLLQSLAEPRPSIRARALVNLGLHPDSLSPGEANILIDRLDEQPRANERQATMFALGMAAPEHLAPLVEHEDEGVRRSAAWWRDQGPAIHDSDVAPAPVPGATPGID